MISYWFISSLPTADHPLEAGRFLPGGIALTAGQTGQAPACLHPFSAQLVRA